MPDDDSLLAQGTVEFRQAERDHANGRQRGTPPVMELVTLRGGPLNGLSRHVRRSSNQVRFQRPLGDGRYWYERAEPGVWRYVEP